MLENMTHDQWVKSLAPKVGGSWNFHSLLPGGMEFFIMLASISGIIGTQGQGEIGRPLTFVNSAKSVL